MKSNERSEQNQPTLPAATSFFQRCEYHSKQLMHGGGGRGMGRLQICFFCSFDAI